MADAGNYTISKHAGLDVAGFKRAKNAGSPDTKAEAAELERNRVTAQANRRFLNRGIAIRDVFGELEGGPAARGIAGYES